MWTVWCKLLGAVCLTVAGGLMGIRRAQHVYERTVQLEALQQFLQSMAELLRLGAGDTTQLIEQAAQAAGLPWKLNGQNGALPQRLQAAFCEMRRQVQGVRQEEWELAERMALRLCTLESAQAQQEACYAAQRMGVCVQSAREQQQIQARLCRTMGTALGAAAALLVL